MNRFSIALLQFAIAAAFAVGLFGQIVVAPGAIKEGMAQVIEGSAVEMRPYIVAYTVIAVLGIACVQVALFALWRLLAMIKSGAIFSLDAFRWLDTIIGAALGATALAFGVFLHLTFGAMPFEQDSSMDALGLWGGAIACVGVGLAFATLMVIMRGLLRKATDLQTEMAEVV
jgi:hypothetical protein